jgi:hypothetical protein
MATMTTVAIKRMQSLHQKILTDKTTAIDSKHNASTSDENCVATDNKPSITFGKKGVKTCGLLTDLK